VARAATIRPSVRLAVYTDYRYHRVAGEIYAERAFALFLARMGTMVEQLVVLGRLHPGSGDARYPMGEAVELIPLPYYPSLAEPLSAGMSMLRSLRSLWRSLDEVDCIWLLGPHPLAFVLVAFASLRRRTVVLGVRQDLPAYVAHRHPGQPIMRLVSRALDWGYRILARRLATVVIGPDLAERYGAAPRLLETAVTLVDRSDIVAPEEARDRDYSGGLTVMSVGRIDREKNPLLLAEVLARLTARGRDWRLVVCGEGSMQGELVRRLQELGLSDRAELRGYVPHDQLAELYSRSHAVLHVSWTEGVPQVLFEAFAAGTPVVATAVGGIEGHLAEAVHPIPPGSADAAVRALEEVVFDADLRARLVAAGHEIVERHTLDQACEEVVDFIANAAAMAAPAAGSVHER
jgi:glycosyltransferase involved in cell wall biosynthesis